MDHLVDDLTSTWQSIVDQKEVATADAIRASEKHRDAAEPELTEMTVPNAYEDHLVEFMHDEKEEFQSDGADGTPLCSCPNPFCPLKKAELPAAVQMADSLEEGIRKYRRQHDGDARVLKDARTEWIGQYSEVKRHLERALTTLRGSDEPAPDEAPGDAEEVAN